MLILFGLSCASLLKVGWICCIQYGRISRNNLAFLIKTYGYLKRNVILAIFLNNYIVNTLNPSGLYC